MVGDLLRVGLTVFVTDRVRDPEPLRVRVTVGVIVGMDGFAELLIVTDRVMLGLNVRLPDGVTVVERERVGEFVRLVVTVTDPERLCVPVTVADHV